jgi:DNA methylase
VRQPYWSQNNAALYVGDARDVLAEMPDRSADTIVTSPPFWGKRDYGVAEQYGLEDTPEQYIDHLRNVFAEAWRVLADDGTVWLNLGDSFAGSWGNYIASGSITSRQPHDALRVARFGTFRPPQTRLRAKNLLGLPWRVAFALQDDGWILRNAIVWHKPNAMPESVRDRLSTRYELIFLLTKQTRYYFDLDAVRVTYTGDRSLARRTHRSGNRPHTIGTEWPPRSGNGTASAAGTNCRQDRHAVDTGMSRTRHAAAPERGRNPGDVWSISTRPSGKRTTRCSPSTCRCGVLPLDADLAAPSSTRSPARQPLGWRPGISVEPSAASS